MSNREAAIFILLGAAFVWMLWQPAVRASMRGVARQLLWSKLTVALVAYLATIGVAVYGAWRLSLWTMDLLAATVLWFLLTGFAWFINLGGAGKDDDFFKRRFLETLGFVAFFEFFVNAQTLPLAWEIVGQVGLAFVVMLNVVAGGEPRFRPVARLTAGLLAAASLGLAGFTAISLVSNWPTVDKAGLLRELLMPVWLAAAVIPYLYLVAFYMGYELLFVRLSFMNDRRPPSVRAKIGLLLGLRGSLVDVGAFTGSFAREAAQSEHIRATLNQVRSFKRHREAEALARTRARDRLADNAGCHGVDEHGLVLDRREFAKTKDALRWLATCHMGWYRRDDRPNEYRRDLLDILVATDSKQLGFESDTPIVSKVRKDGQAWYAYRRTPSGHVFGVGADGPPPSQWFYDGAASPDGYPSERSRGWTHFMSPERPEWQAEPEV
ncbi:hypothetical protein [Barrientosiimonas humi]|uniref:hypothetical protein n=1 Tax=Barrientosiimonas humi TaxID=999931 RepID=UPI00370D764F